MCYIYETTPTREVVCAVLKVEVMAKLVLAKVANSQYKSGILSGFSQSLVFLPNLL